MTSPYMLIALVLAPTVVPGAIVLAVLRLGSVDELRKIVAADRIAPLDHTTPDADRY